MIIHLRQQCNTAIGFNFGLAAYWNKYNHISLNKQIIVYGAIRSKMHSGNNDDVLRWWIQNKDCDAHTCQSNKKTEAELKQNSFESHIETV